MKNSKRDITNDSDRDILGGELSHPSNIPEPQLLAETGDEPILDTNSVPSESEDSVDSDPFGVRTDWPPDDISSIDSGSLGSFNESSLVRDFRHVPRSNPDLDSPSSSPSLASSVATRDQFQRSIAPPIPGLELMLVPIAIICWFKQLFEAFDRWPGPYRERDNGGTLGRRNHPRNWDVGI